MLPDYVTIVLLGLAMLLVLVGRARKTGYSFQPARSGRRGRRRAAAGRNRRH